MTRTGSSPWRLAVAIVVLLLLQAAFGSLATGGVVLLALAGGDRSAACADDAPHG